MPKRATLLLTAAGRRVELLECFRRDARELGCELQIFAADISPGNSPACRVADRCFPVVSGSDPAFGEELLDLCAREKVDLLVPTIDTELEAIAARARRFEAAGTGAVISSADLVALAHSKEATARFLSANGIPGPWTERLDLFLQNPRSRSFPVFVKPLTGSSSKGAFTADSVEAIRTVVKDPAQYVVQELLSGDEYTVNMFFDRHGALRCAIPHQRLETRAGEVSKGITRRMESLERIAAQLGQALPGARGPLCFQAFVDGEGNARVSEINARFGGGYPLAHQAGAKFSQWLLEETLGVPCSANNSWQENVTMLRYDAAVFVKSP